MNHLHPIHNTITDNNLNTLPTLSLKDVKYIIRYLHYLKQREKYKSIPDDELLSLAKNKAIKDTTANGLTTAIILLIEGLEGFATRQQSQGQYNARLGMLTKSTTKKGVTDITGLLNGKPVNIEVKIGKDRQSDDQKKVQQQIEAAGGIYYIAKDLQSTFTWLCSNYDISTDFIYNTLKEACKIFCKNKA